MDENKKYRVTVPSQNYDSIWDEERYKNNFSDLANDYKDARVQKATPNGKYKVRVKSADYESEWDKDRFDKNYNDLSKDYSDAEYEELYDYSPVDDEQTSSEPVVEQPVADKTETVKKTSMAVPADDAEPVETPVAEQQSEPVDLEAMREKMTGKSYMPMDTEVPDVTQGKAVSKSEADPMARWRSQTPAQDNMTEEDKARFNAGLEAMKSNVQQTTDNFTQMVNSKGEMSVADMMKENEIGREGNERFDPRNADRNREQAKTAAYGMLNDLEERSEAIDKEIAEIDSQLKNATGQYESDLKARKKELKAEQKGLSKDLDNYTGWEYVREDENKAIDEMEKKFSDEQLKARTTPEEEAKKKELKQYYTFDDQQNYDVAQLFINEARNVLNQDTQFNNGKTATGEFMKAMGEDISDIEFWTRPISKFQKNAGLLGLAKTIEKLGSSLGNAQEELDIEKVLTPGEQAMLEAYLKLQEMNALRADDTSRAYLNGKSAADTIHFMAEMALTAGASVPVGEAVTMGVVRFMEKRGIGAMVAKAAERTAVQKLERVAIRYGAGLLGDLAQTLVGATLQPSYMSTVVEQMATVDPMTGKLQDKGLAKGMYSTYKEYFTEQRGFLFNKVVGYPLEKVLSGMLGKKATGVIKDWFDHATKTKFASTTAWDSFGENFEELEGAILDRIFLGQEGAVKDFFELDNLLDMQATFAPMFAMNAVLGFGGIGLQEYQTNKARKTARAFRDMLTKYGDTTSEEDWNAFFDSFDSNNADFARMKDEVAKKVMNLFMTNDNLTQDEQKTILKSAIDWLGQESAREVVDIYQDYKDTNAAMARVDEFRERLGHDFWQGEGESRTVTTYQFPDGTTGFITGEANEYGKIPYVTQDGQFHLMPVEDFDENRATTLSIVEFGKAQVQVSEAAAEEERITEEEKPQIENIANTFSQKYQIGSEYTINDKTHQVAAITNDGVQFYDENGMPVDLTWKQIAELEGTPVEEAKTDDTLNSEAAAALEAQDAARAEAKATIDNAIGIGITVNDGQIESVVESSIDTENKTATFIVRMPDGTTQELKGANYVDLVSNAAAEADAVNAQPTPEELAAQQRQAEQAAAAQAETDLDNLFENDPVAFAAQNDAANGEEASRKLIENKIRSLKEEAKKSKEKTDKLIKRKEEAVKAAEKKVDEALTPSAMRQAQNELAIAQAELSAEMENAKADAINERISKYQSVLDQYTATREAKAAAKLAEIQAQQRAEQEAKDAAKAAEEAAKAKESEVLNAVSDEQLKPVEESILTDEQKEFLKNPAALETKARFLAGKDKDAKLPKSGRELVGELLNGKTKLSRAAFDELNNHGGDIDAAAKAGIAYKGNEGGLSLDELAEKLLEMDSETNEGGQFFHGDFNEARTTLEDVLNDVPYEDIHRLAYMRAVEDKKRELMGESDALDEAVAAQQHYAQESYGMTPEEAYAAEYAAAMDILERDGVSEEEINAIFADDYLEENERDKEQTGDSSVTEGVSEDLPGEQPADQRGAEPATEGEGSNGNGEGESVSEEVDDIPAYDGEDMPELAEGMIEYSEDRIDWYDDELGDLKGARERATDEAKRNAAEDKRADIIRKFIDTIKRKSDKVMVASYHNAEEAMRNAGFKDTEIEYLLDRINKNNAVYGFKSSNGVQILFSDAFGGLRAVRRIFVHERQHGLTTLKQKLALSSKVKSSELLDIIHNLGGGRVYDNHPAVSLASEVISRGMEIAYGSRDAAEFRQKWIERTGNSNEYIINFLIDIDNEQRNDRDLSRARWMSNVSGVERGSGSEDERAESGESDSVGGQGLRPAEEGGRVARALEKAITFGDEAISRLTNIPVIQVLKNRIKEELNRFNNKGMPSIDTMSEAVGLKWTKVNGVTKFTDRDGKTVDHIDKEFIKNSRLGDMVRMGVVSGTITEEQADKQYGFFADLFNLMQNVQDIDMIWAVSGAIGFQPLDTADQSYDSKTGRRDESRRDGTADKEKFAAITGNADKQYSKTIDFTTICLKTQAVIDAMSRTMVKLDRGLSEKEIVDIVYNETHKHGEPVPCPVCYVFSRWVGLGGLFNRMKYLQDKYSDVPTSEIRKQVEALEQEILAGKAEQTKRTKVIKKIIDGLQQGKAELNEALNAINDGASVDIDVYYESLKKVSDALYNSLETRKKLNAPAESIQEAIDEIEARINLLNDWAWFSNVRLAKDYKPVPSEILFDINRGKEFAEQYPDAWKYRTTRGPAMGKAAAPYSPLHLGQVIKGLSTAGLKDVGVMSKNSFLVDSKDSDRVALVKKAIAKVRAQNLFNGQRWQSTSDFRFEYFLDYLMGMLEMQAAGSKVQLYTKVPEAVRFLASCNAECNLSLMPLGNGFDSKGNLAFSAVTGMSGEDAKALSATYDNVQPIMVGISMEHIIACMKSDWITFIIPYHASGSSENRYKSMMETVEEKIDDRTDFSAYQSDHKWGTHIPEDQKDRKFSGETVREVRKRILTGAYSKKGTAKFSVPEADKQVMKEYPILAELVKRFYGVNMNGKKEAIDAKYLNPGATDNTIDEDCYMAFLTGGQADDVPVMPYEYWDKTTTLETADVNGDEFKKYCSMLGMFPRFSGYTSKGDHRDDRDLSVEKGYWKVLPDRKMYNNDGTYHVQKPVSLDNVDMSYLNGGKEIVAGTSANEASKQMESTRNEGIKVPSKPNHPEKVEEIADASIKRINEQEKGIRYSDRRRRNSPVTAEQDAEFRKAYEEKDIAKAQALLELAAKASGYNYKGFHGTNAVFNVFDADKLGSRNWMAPSASMGFFASSSKETADSYTGLNSMDTASLHFNQEAQDNMSRIKAKYNYDEAERKDNENRAKFEEKYKAEHNFEEEVDKMLGYMREIMLKDEWLKNKVDNVEEYVSEATKNLKNTLEYQWRTKIEEGEKYDRFNLMNWAYDETPEHKEFTDLQQKIYDEWEQTEIKRLGYTPNVKSLYIKLENPLVHDFKGEGRDTESFAARMAAAQAEGRDGCIFLNVADGADIDDIYTVFNNTQFKSADVFTFDEDGELIPLSERFNSENKDIRYRDSESISRDYPNWLDGTTDSDGGHSTQVTNTKSTYEKVGNWIKENVGENASVLDASSGLGLGTIAMRDMGLDVEDVEPYPDDKRERPTYTSYSDITKKYDAVVSSAVLNVIPDDWRHDVVQNMAKAVKAGGKMVVSVRNDKEIARQGKEGETRITLDSPSEILVTNKKGEIRAYQKGFSQAELVDYLKSELGDRWIVEPQSKANLKLGGTTAVATRMYDVLDRDTRMKKQHKTSNEDKMAALNKISDKLGVDIVVHNKAPKGISRTAEGWYDIETGKIHVNINNLADAADAIATVLHEAVAHHGLRQMFGKDFDTAMTNIYNNVSPEVKKEIDALIANGYAEDEIEAVEEYMAMLAEDGIATEEEANAWDIIKHFIIDMLRKFGINLGNELSEEDLRYILWESKRRLENRNLAEMAENANTRNWMAEDAHNSHKEDDNNPDDPDKSGNKPTRYRDRNRRRTTAPSIEKILNDAAITDEMNTSVANAAALVSEDWQQVLKEVLFDRLTALENALRIAEKASGKDMTDDENVLSMERARPGKNKADVDKYTRKFVEPLFKVLREINKKAGLSKDEINEYVQLKHGLEVNIYKAKEHALKHYAGILKGVESRLRSKCSKDIAAVLADQNLTDEEKDRQKERLLDQLELDLEQARNNHEAKYGAIVDEITNMDDENITDDVYRKFREKEYGAVRVWFADFPNGMPDREQDESWESYVKRVNDARELPDGFDDLKVAEDAAKMRIADYESRLDTYADKLWDRIRKATDETIKYQRDHHMISMDAADKILGNGTPGSRMYNYYVPLRGFAEDVAEDLYDMVSQSGKSKYEPTMRYQQGRSSKPDSPWGFIAAMYNSAVLSGNRNNVRRALYNFVARRPDNGIMRISDAWYVDTGSFDMMGRKIWEPRFPDFSNCHTAAEMDAVQQQFDADMKALAENKDTIQRSDVLFPEEVRVPKAVKGSSSLNLIENRIRTTDEEKQSYVVPVTILGKEKVIMFNGSSPRAAQALNDELRGDKKWTWFDSLRNFRARVFTTFSLPFGFANWVRDMQYGSFYLINNEDKEYIGKFISNIPKAFSLFTMIRNDGEYNGTSSKRHALYNLYNEYRDNGGFDGQSVLYDNEHWESQLTKWERKGAYAKYKTARNIEKMFGFFTDVVESMEQFMRFTAFVTSRESGRGLSESISDAKEITTNFSRRGTVRGFSWKETAKLRYTDENGSQWRLGGSHPSGAWGTSRSMKSFAIRSIVMLTSNAAGLIKLLYPFFNASMQGMYAMKYNKIARGVIPSMFFGAMWTMFNIGGGGDDDKTKGISKYQWSHNFMMRMGDEKLRDIKIPITQDFAPFWSIGTDLARAFMYNSMDNEHKDTEFGKKLVRELPYEVLSSIGDLSTFNPLKPEAPAYLDIIVAIARNRDYMNATISNRYDWNKRMPNFTKARYDTWGLMVDFCEWLNSTGSEDKAGNDFKKNEVRWKDLDPALLQYAVEQLFGGMATTIAGTVDMISNWTQGEDANINATPILSRFLYDEDALMHVPWITEEYRYYYDKAEDVEQQLNGFKKEGDDAARAKVESSHAYRYYEAYKNFKKDIDANNKLLKQIAEDDTETRRTVNRDIDELRMAFIQQCRDSDIDRNSQD